MRCDQQLWIVVRHLDVWAYHMKRHGTIVWGFIANIMIIGTRAIVAGSDITGRGSAFGGIVIVVGFE